MFSGFWGMVHYGGVKPPYNAAPVPPFGGTKGPRLKRQRREREGCRQASRVASERSEGGKAVTKIGDFFRGQASPKAAPVPETPKGVEGAGLLGGDAPPPVERKPATWTKQALFALVRENTSRAQALGVIERAKAPVSDSTARNYEGLARGRIDAAEDGGGPGLAGVSKASFYPTRAAILWTGARAAQDARKRADVAQKGGDLAAAVLAALEAARALDAIEGATRAKAPEGPAAPRKSKRRDLPSSDYWQSVVMMQASPAPKPMLAVMWAVGARPCELEMGVDLAEVRHPKTGKPLVLVTIPGGKVTAENGQPQRTILMDGSHPAGIALLQVLDGKKKVTVKRRAATIKDDFKMLQKKLTMPVSAYSFRHQVAANAKASMAPEKVACVLGQASARTQQRYGSKQQAQKGGGGILRAEAVRPIRQLKASPGPGPVKPEAARPDRPGPAT